MKPCPQRSTLFPYTTLFRSHDEDALRGGPDFLELLLEATEEVRVLRVNPAHVGGDGLAQLRQIEHPRLAVVLHLAKDRKSTRLNSSHITISYAVFCLKKKKQ